jgi:hypothetical protein
MLKTNVTALFLIRTHAPFRCARIFGRLPVRAGVLHNNAANLDMTQRAEKVISLLIPVSSALLFVGILCINTTLTRFIVRHVRKIEKSDMSVCMGLGSHYTGVSWNIIFEYFSKICPEKFKFHVNMTRITGTLHEDLCTFMITSRSVLFNMRYVSDKSYRENQNPHFVFNIFFFRKSCRLWDNV